MDLFHLRTFYFLLEHIRYVLFCSFFLWVTFSVVYVYSRKQDYIGFINFVKMKSLWSEQSVHLAMHIDYWRLLVGDWSNNYAGSFQETDAEAARNASCVGVSLCGCRCKHLLHADSAVGAQLGYFFFSTFALGSTRHGIQSLHMWNCLVA